MEEDEDIEEDVVQWSMVRMKKNEKWNPKLMNVEGEMDGQQKIKKMDGLKHLRGSRLEKSNHIWILFPCIVRRAIYAGNNDFFTLVLVLAVN